VFRRAQAARLLAVDHGVPATRLLVLGRNEVMVGTAEDSALRIADFSVAEHHAVIRYARGRHFVRDLKSASGTFLNGKQIRRTRALAHGDQLRFGNALRYRFIDPDALRRQRHRRTLRAVLIAAVIAAGAIAHFERWDGGVLSPATVTDIAQWVKSLAAIERAPAPAAVVERSVAPPAPPASAAAAGATGATPAAASATAAPPASMPVAASSPPISSPPIAPVWLARINRYRAMVGLGALHENPALSASSGAHAQYMLANYAEVIRRGDPLGDAGHDEDRARPGYSASGAEAARNSQLAWGCNPYDAEPQIDHWFAGPFHRLPMLNPLLMEAGFGQAAAADGCWIAALRLPPPPQEVKPYEHPIEFPPDGATVSLAWTGAEFPDPLASCPGYATPAGLPITLQLGRLVETQLTAHMLTENGSTVEHCAFDAHSYVNPNAKAQEYGRWALRSAGAVMVIPRAPLQPGARYSVTIAAHGQIYAWAFQSAQ